MNCLCCGKPLRPESAQLYWHKSCIRKFFGTSALPEIVIDEKTLEFLTAESINKGQTVPGVQKKLSLHLFSEENRPRLIAGNGSFAYITKRIDRIFEKNGVRMLAMEDFCQLDQRLTQDKYKGSYERCAKIIDRYSSRKGLDMTELYLRLVFSFIVGNSDMHLKNFSLIETEEGSGRYLLSPAYDLLPVNVIMPEDKEQFALTMNGKKTNIRRKDFFIFADACGISRSSAGKMTAMLVSKKKKFIDLCSDSFLPVYLKERFIALIENRVAELESGTPSAS